MKFQRGDLVEVMGKIGGQPWPHARGIVTGFYFGPTQDLIHVHVLEAETPVMLGPRLYSPGSLALVEAG